MLPTILFYVFSIITIGSALAVIVAKNPVHCVLFLILAFFNVAGLFLLLGAEFLAMLLVIVYVGAVAILFLFVVMMLNIDTSRMKGGFIKNMVLGLVIAGILFVEIFFALSVSISDVNIYEATSYDIQSLTNTEALGLVIYTQYAYLFQLAGLILLVAMIGAIVLTHRTRSGVRKQNITQQLLRDPKETVKLVKVKSAQGKITGGVK